LGPPRTKSDHNHKNSGLQISLPSLEPPAHDHAPCGINEEDQTTFTHTMNALQRRIVHMERNQKHNKFPPRNGYRYPPPNQRPPIALEPTNMLEHKHPYYCRHAKVFMMNTTYLERVTTCDQNGEDFLDTCNNVFDGK
jgi:hypothetical protein